MVKNKFETKYVYDWDETTEPKVSFSLDSRRQPTQEKERERPLPRQIS